MDLSVLNPWLLIIVWWWIKVSRNNSSKRCWKFQFSNKKVLFPPKKLSVPCTIKSSFFRQQISPWCPNFPHQRFWTSLLLNYVFRVPVFESLVYLLKFNLFQHKKSTVSLLKTEFKTKKLFARNLGMHLTSWLHSRGVLKVS